MRAHARERERMREKGNEKQKKKKKRKKKENGKWMCVYVCEREIESVCELPYFCLPARI